MSHVDKSKINKDLSQEFSHQNKTNLSSKLEKSGQNVIPNYSANTNAYGGGKEIGSPNFFEKKIPENTFKYPVTTFYEPEGFKIPPPNNLGYNQVTSPTSGYHRNSVNLNDPQNFLNFSLQNKAPSNLDINDPLTKIRMSVDTPFDASGNNNYTKNNHSFNYNNFGGPSLDNNSSILTK